MRRLAGACALLAACAAGCGKTDDRALAKPPTTPASGGSGAGGSASVKPGEMVDSACTVPGPSPGPAPLAALSNYEVNRSVRALLGDGPQPSAWLVEEGEVNPFWSAAPPAVVAQMHDLARDVALTLSRDAKAVRAFSGCDPQTSGNATCATSFIDEFLPRAYRRPVTAEDQAAMKAVFTEGERLGGDFASGVRAVVEVALQGPDFLYLIETGNGDSTNGVVALTGYESAARLAYFLTAAPPDDQLRAASAQGALSADTLEEEARRLLGSPASRERLRHYYVELLGLGRVDPRSELDQVLSQLALEETGRFVEDVTFDGAGTFRALLTEPSTWVNEQLAQHYGLSGVSGPEFRKVALDPAQRAGILTQAAFLSVGTHGSETAPVQRGLGVLHQVLCYQMPPPPPDVTVMIPEPLPEPATMRQRLTAMTHFPECQECHAVIDPVGFAFERYDVAGKWRDTDHGLPVDASGTLVKTDAGGTFKDAVELVHRIAESNDAKACFVQHWQAQAFRRPADAGDACATEQISQAFADSDGNLVELMVALAKSDNFRYRLKSELAP